MLGNSRFVELNSLHNGVAGMATHPVSDPISSNVSPTLQAAAPPEFVAATSPVKSPTAAPKKPAFERRETVLAQKLEQSPAPLKIDAKEDSTPVPRLHLLGVESSGAREPGAATDRPAPIAGR